MNAEQPTLIGQRYRRVRSIARGGVGEVLEVWDEREHRKLALKSLLGCADPKQREELDALFRNEYSTLAQFAHPNVVQVFDFGTHDGELPFYTMELLEGSHPGAPQPMPWREVCRMLVTLCAPLTLLHSRGWVHRDVSPRNVCVLPDGTPKLLDFGAMAALDEAHRPMGTPACLAPESLHRERIDARTDLYGLGALGYCALTGRHAYQARTLEQLPFVWQTPPPAPSSLIADIPAGLDDVILSMLSLEMSERPRQLAEVAAHLIAIADLPIDGERQLAQACLTTPGLVGLDEQRARLRELLNWAKSGRAASCVVRGERGAGCKRLLDSLAVDAKVLGFAIMRSDASRVGRSEFGVVRELGGMGWAGDAGLSGAAVARFEAATRRLAAADSGDSERNDVQRTFIELCEHRAATQPLLIVVDEAELADVASMRLLVHLQRRRASARLLIVLSKRPLEGGPPPALQAFAREASLIELAPLDGPRVEALMRALFGDVPNLAYVADWIRTTSGGHIADCIAAAKALVESGQAQFFSGSWHLPDRLAPQLSATTSRALERSVDRLFEPARALLRLMAAADPRLLPLRRYRQALPGSEAQRVAAEGELLAKHLLVTSPDGYDVRNPQLLPSVRARMAPDELRACHERLAAFYVGEKKPLYAAFHLWRAGHLEQADRQLTAALDWRGDCADFDAGTFARGVAVIPMYEALLVHRKQHGATPAQLFQLRMPLLTLAALNDSQLDRYTAETVTQLRFDAGLDFTGHIEPATTPHDYIMACLGFASQRYAALPVNERGLNPELAIRGIASCVVALTGVTPLRYDIPGAKRAFELIAPLATLAPSLALVANLAEQCMRSIVRDEDITALRIHAIETTTSDVPALSTRQRDAIHYFSSYHLAMDYAAEGDARALELAAKLDAQTAFQPLALQVRRMHALVRGDYAAAQRYRRERELLPFQSTASDQHVQASVLREVGGALWCRDLLELARCRHMLDQQAARAPGWQPWAAVGHAVSHLIADEPVEALAAARKGLATIEPFEHGAWAHLVLHCADALIVLGDFTEARRLMRELLGEVDARGLHILKRYVFDATLALAEVGCGEHERGMQRLDEILAAFAKRLGRDNVIYGNLCETRCHAAVLAQDYAGFARHVEELCSVYAGHPALRARYARWVRVGEACFQQALQPTAAALRSSWSTRLASDLTSQRLDDRAEYLLGTVLEEAGVDAGMLFRIEDGHLLLMAAQPSRPEAHMLRAAQALYANWNHSDELDTAIGEVSSGGLTPLWLTHPARPEHPIGLVLLRCDLARLAQLSAAFVRAVTEHLEMLSR